MIGMPRESKAARTARALQIVERLAAAYPRSTCALRNADPFQLLVATVLSAQTTDAAVNAATPGLFAAFPTAAAMAAAEAGAIEEQIRTIGLWRSKAKYLRGLSAGLVERHGGRVPADPAALTALPGVAHKTATAVLGTAFGMAAGVTVDTHMLRINRLLGLSASTSAPAMARELEALIPQEAWTTYTHRVIDHGRIVCVARRPRCGVCPLAVLCPSARSAAAGWRPANDAKIPAAAAQASWLVVAAEPR